MKGGDSPMSGTFTKNPDAYFVNLDLIAWTGPIQSSNYPGQLLNFVAQVERTWVSLGGMPAQRQDVRLLRPNRPRSGFLHAAV